jgi:hypothetical protein
MRSPAHFRRAEEKNRQIADAGAIDGVHSINAVLWDIGLVLAVFLGLTLTATAALTALGIH